jgi:DNA-binding MarR family transcriptional regulator
MLEKDEDMDYRALAEEMFHSIAKHAKSPFHQVPRDASHGEIGILACLARTGDGLSSGELGRLLQITTGRVATALKSLEKKGYIVRRHDPRDKRRVLVYITEPGREFAMAKRERALSEIEKTLQLLGEEDAKELVRIVKRIFELSRSSG